MTIAYFLGVDVGNTKSHALIADEHGTLAGFARAGCGNHEVIGYPRFGELIAQLVTDAMNNAKLSASDISGAGFGISGYDWPSQKDPLLEGIAKIGLGCPMEMVNDTLIGLIAGAPSGWGIGLVAGTGSNCWGMDAQGHFGRMTGLSYLMDEGGGAFSIVMWAIQAIGRAWTQRGPKTMLTDAFLSHFNQQDVLHLLELLSAEQIPIDASLAPLVIESGKTGDGVALAIIQQAVESLASLCVGVAHQLDLMNQAVDVVLIGSVFNAGSIFINPLAETIHASLPLAQLVRLEAPPVVGGVLLGMRQVSVQPGQDAIARLKLATSQEAS